MAKNDDGTILEDCTRKMVSDFAPVNHKPIQIVKASNHPYENDLNLKDTFIEPGASGFELTFDHRSHLERYHDRLSLTPFFYRTYSVLYHKFGNMIIFRAGNLSSLCSPGNQHYQKIIIFIFLIEKLQGPEHFLHKWTGQKILDGPD